MFRVKEYIKLTFRDIAFNESLNSRETSQNNVMTVSNSNPKPPKRAKVGNSSLRLVCGPVDFQDLSPDQPRNIEQEVIQEINLYYNTNYKVEEDTCPLMFFREKRG